MVGLAALTLFLAAEGLALYSLDELFASGGNHAIAWWAFVVVALAAYGLPRLAETFRWQSRRAQSAIAVTGLALVYVLLHLQFPGHAAPWDFSWVSNFVSASGGNGGDGFRIVLGGALLATAWVHVSRHSVDGVEIPLMPREVGLELAAVTGVMVVGAMAGRGGEIGRAGAGFYATAVLALACGQLSLSGVSIGEGAAGALLSTLLAGTAAAVVAALVVITLVFGVAGPIIGPPLGHALNLLLTIVVTPLAWAISGLVHLFLGSHAQWPKIDPAQITDPGQARQQQNSDHGVLPAWVIYAFRAALLLGFVAASYLVFQWFSRFRRRLRELGPDGPGSAASGSLRQDLGAAFHSLFQRRHWPGDNVADSRASRLYLEVLTQSERAGRARAPAETPSEFAPALAETFQTRVTDEITRAFEQARYAGRHPSPEAIEDLERRWRSTR